jgi:arylsulfatase A-like enzyme
MKNNNIKEKNIILISIDCLRADHLKCMGYSKNISPNIDNLAENGMFFTNAFSNAPYTNYSIPSFITSRIPPIGKNFKETIGTILKKANYSTGAINPNPIVLSPSLTESGRIDKGFDYFDLMLNTKKNISVTIGGIRQWAMKDARYIFNEQSLFYKLFFSIYDKMIKTFPSVLCPKEHKIIPRVEEVNKKAIEWIKKQNNKFFLWLHYMDAHEPYAPPEYENKNEMLYLATKYRDFPNKLTQKEIEKLMELYDLSIKHTDKEIGNFIKKLNEMDLLKDCIIILTSDHGDAFGEHNGILGHGGKFDEQLYDEIIHVPLIMYGIEKWNKPNDKLIHLLDLAPTICDIVGIPIPPIFYGKSIFNNSKNKGIIINSLIKMAYRTENYKLIFNKKHKQDKKIYELYDIKNDIDEEFNIYYEKPAISKKLQIDMINLLNDYDKKKKMLNVKKFIK